MREGFNQIVMRHKVGTQSDRKSQKRGHRPRTSLLYTSMGKYCPGVCVVAKLSDGVAQNVGINDSGNEKGVQITT